MADPYGRAKALLDALPAAFPATGARLLPARRHVLNSSLAAAAVECEMAVVAVERVFSGLPGAESALPVLCVEPRSVELTAAVFRCVPTGGTTPPGAAAVDASAAEMMADLDNLEDAVRAASTGGALAADPYDIVIGRGFLVGPSGGYGGAALTVTVPV